MRSILVLVIALALLSVGVMAGPNLIVRKQALAARGLHPTVHNEMIVTLDLYNVGDADAFDVKLEDTWHVDFFPVVKGSPSASWEVIPAGGNVTHTFVVVPSASGYLETRRASVDYKASAHGEVIRGVSTSLQGLRIYEPNEADMLSFAGAHFKEFTVFLFFAFLSVAGPALIYNNVQKQKAELKKNA